MKNRNLMNVLIAFIFVVLATNNSYAMEPAAKLRNDNTMLCKAANAGTVFSASVLFHYFTKGLCGVTGRWSNNFNNKYLDLEGRNMPSYKAKILHNVKKGLLRGGRGIGRLTSLTLGLTSILSPFVGAILAPVVYQTSCSNEEEPIILVSNLEDADAKEMDLPLELPTVSRSYLWEKAVKSALKKGFISPIDQIRKKLDSTEKKRCC